MKLKKFLLDLFNKKWTIEYAILRKAKASVARNFSGASLLKKGTIEYAILRKAKASVARNFSGASLLKKGTVK